MLRKHVNNHDVALEVIKSFYVKEKKVWKVKVRWWNIGVSHPPWSMGIVETITVDNSAWRMDWKPYEWRPIDKQLIMEKLREHNTSSGSTVDK